MISKPNSITIFVPMNFCTKYLLAVLTLSWVFGTNLLVAQTQKDAVESYKMFARMHIDSLKKNGAVLVILKSKSRAIEAYEKSGNTKVANEMMEKLQVQNTRMMKAYRSFWNFCPIYFIYSNELNAFNSGVRDHIFVDSTMKISSTIQMQAPFYIFHDYGTFYEVQNKSHDSAPGKWKNTEYSNYDSSEGVPVKSDCIVVRDKLMRQYRYPFPDYIQTWGSLTGLKKAIEILNARFTNTYKLGFDINAAF